MKTIKKVIFVGLLVSGLTACGGGGGPSDLEVTQLVRRDIEGDGYKLSSVTNIKCRSEKGAADLYTCSFKLKFETGSPKKNTACFKYDGRRWLDSGVGRNCYAFS